MTSLHAVKEVGRRAHLVRLIPAEVPGATDESGVAHWPEGKRVYLCGLKPAHIAERVFQWTPEDEYPVCKRCVTYIRKGFA